MSDWFQVHLAVLTWRRTRSILHVACESISLADSLLSIERALAGTAGFGVRVEDAPLTTVSRVESAGAVTVVVLAWWRKARWR